MLLALDVGNTNVVGGLYDGSRLAARWRVSTDARRTTDELRVLWQGLFHTRGLAPRQVSGACLASVVPALTGTYLQLVRELMGVPALVVGLDLDLGIRVDTDNPPEVGADRIANALAARERYGAPAVVVDFGTSTNFDVVSREGAFVGGVIAPGMAASVDALVARTAQLPRVALRRPDRAIGRNTAACMQSGAFFGYVGLIEGLIDRILAEVGGPAPVIATGGLASVMAPETTKIAHVDPDLTLDGIRLVWERNAAVAGGEAAAGATHASPLQAARRTPAS
jgi:type III pantothenate kinase